MKIPVTLWYRLARDKDGNDAWDYNHLENGCVSTIKPTPKHPDHNRIWNGNWMRKHAFLDENNKVVENEYDQP